MLVTSTVFKCDLKFTPETGSSAGGEGQEYEEVDGGKGGVAVGDPTYMEVGERRAGNTFQLRENEAYASQVMHMHPWSHAYASLYKVCLFAETV